MPTRTRPCGRRPTFAANWATAATARPSRPGSAGWPRTATSRDFGRLLQLVELAYTYDAQATTRPDDFVRLVQQKRVEDARSAPARVMTIHQSKGLQFDIVVLPELDARLVGQPGQVAVGRASPTAPVERVCRHVAKEPPRPAAAGLEQMFDDGTRLVVEESLSVLYVAMTPGHPRPAHHHQPLGRERTLADLHVRPPAPAPP